MSINGCIGPTIHPSSGQWSNLYPTGQFMETEMTSQDELVWKLVIWIRTSLSYYDVFQYCMCSVFGRIWAELVTENTILSQIKEYASRAQPCFSVRLWLQSEVKLAVPFLLYEYMNYTVALKSIWNNEIINILFFIHTIRPFVIVFRLTNQKLSDFFFHFLFLNSVLAKECLESMNIYLIINVVLNIKKKKIQGLSTSSENRWCSWRLLSAGPTQKPVLLVLNF